MPQFEFYSFPEQNFFLLFFFFFMYFFIIFIVLPNFAEVLKMRRKLTIYYSLTNLAQTKVDLISPFYAILLKKKK